MSERVSTPSPQVTSHKPLHVLCACPFLLPLFGDAALMLQQAIAMSPVAAAAAAAAAAAVSQVGEAGSPLVKAQLQAQVRKRAITAILCVSRRRGSPVLCWLKVCSSSGRSEARYSGQETAVYLPLARYRHHRAVIDCPNPSGQEVPVHRLTPFLSVSTLCALSQAIANTISMHHGIMPAAAVRPAANTRCAWVPLYRT